MYRFVYKNCTFDRVSDSMREIIKRIEAMEPPKGSDRDHVMFASGFRVARNMILAMLKPDADAARRAAEIAASMRTVDHPSKLITVKSFDIPRD